MSISASLYTFVHTCMHMCTHACARVHPLTPTPTRTYCTHKQHSVCTSLYTIPPSTCFTHSDIKPTLSLFPPPVGSIAFRPDPQSSCTKAEQVKTHQDRMKEGLKIEEFGVPVSVARAWAWEKENYKSNLAQAVIDKLRHNTCMFKVTQFSETTTSVTATAPACSNCGFYR